ncbi:MAG: SDR family oxidoreductase [Chloroflexi bacterium]|nr:SDR family oxidoreductase [Chloroflexota bacterium]
MGPLRGVGELRFAGDDRHRRDARVDRGPRRRDHAQLSAGERPGRLGQPSDIASAVAFLSSARAEWITGQVLSVNGGYSMAS